MNTLLKLQYFMVFVVLVIIIASVFFSLASSAKPHTPEGYIDPIKCQDCNALEAMK